MSNSLIKRSQSVVMFPPTPGQRSAPKHTIKESLIEYDMSRRRLVRPDPRSITPSTGSIMVHQHFGMRHGRSRNGRCRAWAVSRNQRWESITTFVLLWMRIILVSVLKVISLVVD